MTVIAFVLPQFLLFDSFYFFTVWILTEWQLLLLTVPQLLFYHSFDFNSITVLLYHNFCYSTVIAFTTVITFRQLLPSPQFLRFIHRLLYRILYNFSFQLATSNTPMQQHITAQTHKHSSYLSPLLSTTRSFFYSYFFSIHIFQAYDMSTTTATSTLCF